VKTQSCLFFLKASALSSGGLVLGMSFLESCEPLGKLDEVTDTVVRVFTNDSSNFNELHGFSKNYRQ
jgi:hypothetical protein